MLCNLRRFGDGVLIVLQAPKPHAFILPQLPGRTMLKDVGEFTGEDSSLFHLGFVSSVKSLVLHLITAQDQF